MKPGVFLLAVLLVINAPAITRYVDLNSPSPTPPYLEWTTAATNIQDAIDAALDGDLVLVTNGVYSTGGLVVHGDITNRVAVTKPITVQSVNGFEATVIQGYQVSGTTNGSGAVRCAYLVDGASLIGFTLTNGATSSSGGSLSPQLQGGGAYCETTNSFLKDCLIVGNAAYCLGGGVVGGRLTNCELRSNVASVGRVYLSGGGGAYRSVLYLCLISSNIVHDLYGGGAMDSTLIDCLIVGNRNFSAAGFGAGGGVRGGVITNCIVIGNQIGSGGGGHGGGVHGSLCFNSLIVSNAAMSGGGAANATLNNCVLVGNTATNAGGALGGSLINCSVVGNTAANEGGGIHSSSVNNCIVYFNEASNYTSNRFLGSGAYNCVSPQTSGAGSFTNAPRFVDLFTGNLRLQSNSPCVNAGNNAFVSSNTDRDGRLRIFAGSVDIGAYEYQGPGTSEFIGWLQNHALPTDGSADFVDTDTDGMNNYGEWRSDTVPTNVLSVLRMVSANASPVGANVSWQSVTTRSYWLERATNLGIGLPFEAIATNILGVAGTKTYTDASATNGGPYFYRVGVQ